MNSSQIGEHLLLVRYALEYIQLAIAEVLCARLFANFEIITYQFLFH